MLGNLKKILLAGSVVCAVAGVCACAGDVTPPVLTLYEQPQAYLDEAVTVRKAEAVDDEDGNVSVTVAVISPSNEEIGHSNGTFTPHEEGIYRIVFTAKDKAGNVATEESELVVRRRGGKPVISVGEYESAVREGTVYTLPEYSATDGVGSVDVIASVTDPNGESVALGVGNCFFVDFAGVYKLRLRATNAENETTVKTIQITSVAAEKTVDGIDGDISDGIYQTATSSRIGGLRNLEAIGVKIARGENGIYFAFDASEDKRVSSGEKIEVYLDKEGTSLYPTSTGSFRIDLSPDGSFELMRGAWTGHWSSANLASIAYSRRPAVSVALAQGTTLESGNDTDCGYTAEIFVPYQLLGISADESFYLSFGCRREGDSVGWDGWNEFAVFPDTSFPYRFVEMRPDGWLHADNRLYHSDKIDGYIDDAKYTDPSAASPRVGGLRNLEGLNVKIARDEEGLYFAFDISEDALVNDHDRVELYLDIGEFHSTLNRECNVVFWLQSNGGLQVLYGHNGGYSEIIPYDAMPSAATSYGEGTTPNDNTDSDNGWYGELFIPYELFNIYTKAEGIDETSRLGLTFGLWRASTEYNTGTTWGSDPNKDWDGWSFGEFCDPLYPSTYAVLLPGGEISTRDAILDQLGEPTDPSVDGVLSEEYWNEGAVLDIPKGEELDGVQAIVYRDTEGIRVAFKGDAHKLTSKDVIVFYVSTKDSAYTIGGDLDDAYDVHGRYANLYDFTFRLKLDRSAAVYRGLYKDWADQITDLSAISFAVNLAAEECSYIAELYIPYSFLQASDGFVPTAKDTIGVTLRLGGENARGSVLWNNYRYAGIECDSESPASYVRIDQNNKLFAALENDGGYRIDGSFDESVYSEACAELSVNGANAELYRSEKGIHAKVVFGTADCLELVFSTLDHGLGVPYVYDFRITLYADGTVESSFGNTHGFYDPTLNVSYCAPRAVFNGNTAELFISYEYLSRYNTGTSYGEKGWMQITQESELRIAARTCTGTSCDGNAVYNGDSVGFDVFDPETYLTLTEKEV